MYNKCAIYFHARARINKIVTPCSEKDRRGLEFVKGRWLLIQLRFMLSHIGCVNRRQRYRFLHYLFYIRSKLCMERKKHDIILLTMTSSSSSSKWSQCVCCLGGSSLIGV